MPGARVVRYADALKLERPHRDRGLPAFTVLDSGAMPRSVGLPVLLLALGLAAGVLAARLPPDFERTVVTRHHHGSDPLLTAVLLRFDVASLLDHPARYFRPPFLYPDENPQRGTEPLIAEALLAVPFRLVLGDRPAPVFTWVRIATLALVTLGTGLMLRDLGARPSLALMGGGLAVLVATTAVFFDRLQAVSLQWLPLGVAGAARFWRDGRLRHAAAFAACVFLTIQASLYTAVMLFAVFPFLAPALVTMRRVEGAGRRLAGLALAAAAAGGLSVLVLWPYLQDREDVAAYATRAFAAEKSWGTAVLMDALTSPPEWPLRPPANWDGVFPGAAFVLLVTSVAALGLGDGARALRASGRGERKHRGAFGASKGLLGLLLMGLVGTVAWEARVGGDDAARVLAGVLLWAALACWCGRLTLWPRLEDHEETRLRLLASLFSLAAFVSLLLSLGSPVRASTFGEPLAEGLFGPVSALLGPLREMRELKRFVLPAGWAAVVAATLMLEVRLRTRPRAVAPVLAALVVAVGVGERLRADTRKVNVPPPPDPYALLQDSRTAGGLLELPFDQWGGIRSVHRMLWQPSHGRPIVAGKTGIDPAWYTPARAVFNEFPSEESVLLMRAWGLDCVLDRRSSPLPGPLPEGVVVRGRRQTPGRDGEWTLLDVLPGASPDALAREPVPGPGAWPTPLVLGDPAGEAGAAADGSLDTAAEVTRPEGLRLAVPEGAVSAVQLDYGRGRFSRVPPKLTVLGLVDGEWRDLTEGLGGAFLRARAANQFLRTRSARLVIPVATSPARQIRLVSSSVPWDLPEVRLRVAP